MPSASNNEKIDFLKVREVKNCTRAHDTDAGIDFYVPAFNSNFVDYTIKQNPKTFELQEEPEVEKYPETGPSTFMVSSGTTVSYVSDSGQAVIKKTAPKDFFGFDIEKGEPYFILEPGKGVKIPSGFHVKLKPKTMLRAANKSGVATRDLLDITAEIVDEGYQGEIHIALKNDSQKDVRIYQNQKIVQFIEMPIIVSEVSIHETGSNGIAEFYSKSSQRGDGGFGSSDKKDK